MITMTTIVPSPINTGFPLSDVRPARWRTPWHRPGLALSRAKQLKPIAAMSWWQARASHASHPDVPLVSSVLTGA